MSRWLALLLLIAGGSCANASDTVRERLESVALLRGEFEQVKHVQGFRHPLRSSGIFVLAREHGVIWETREPFPSLVVASPEQVVAIEGEGRRDVLVDGAGTPGARAANALLLALIGGDIDALAARFELRETALPDGGWRLELLPRAAELKRALTRVTLSGDRHVREAAIEEVGGDRSEIRFSQLSSSPSTLSAEEASRFD